MANTIDLHTHSTASDGLYTPTELMHKAHEARLRILALTDHDTTDGIEEAQTAARKLGLELIPGIELNTDVGKDEIHILGYFLEYQRPGFQAILKVLRDARIRRGERMVELLNEQGIKITWERVRTIAQGAVGRPHVAKALMEAGYVNSISEAFDKYIGKDRPAYVPRYKLSPTDAVRLIRSANGLPVIAHPIGLPGLSQLRIWLPELKESGLVGIEAYYGPYTQEEEQQLKNLAAELGLIATGGTDYHGPGIHPTPLGGRYVPAEAVTELKKASQRLIGINPPSFELPRPSKEA